jgi:hypothetical protein
MIEGREEFLAEHDENVRLHTRVEELEAQLAEKDVEIARLKLILAKFKTYGTDGCKSCETGRVNLFMANDECISCNPESYHSVTLAEAQLAARTAPAPAPDGERYRNALQKIEQGGNTGGWDTDCELYEEIAKNALEPR